MNINSINSTPAFGRALTTREKKEYEKTVTKAREVLGTDKTVATVFDFSIPTAKKDTGIGTTFSNDAQALAGMLKTMCGINGIQLQPQGQISNYIRSPYSGTGFSLGEHLIDLTKLATPDSGNLLSKKDLSTEYMNRVADCETVDYENVFAADGQKAMLKVAYSKFKDLDETSQLKSDFEQFKKDNEYWVEKDALFEAMCVRNGSEDMSTWSERDKNVFATKDGDKEVIEELKQITDEDGNNIVDFEEFVQFIADKQQKEAKAEFNSQGIDVYGDCQIGFSDKDLWAHKSAFSSKYEFGCDIGNGQYSCWSPAIDFNKLDSDAGELLYNKFNLFFKRYDGARIDAAWQLITPLICEPLYENGEPVYDWDGNKLGNKLPNQPQIKNDKKQIIKDIVLKAADDNNIKHDKVFLELLGGNSYDSLDAVKDLGASLIHITRYGKDDWGRVKYYESQGSNKYQNLRPQDYIIGPGTHDDPSLIEQLRENNSRAGYLAKDLGLNEDELKYSVPQMSEAAFAELFTTNNQFFTLPDILGSERRINTPNKTEGNWQYRVSRDYEKAYHENLSQYKGLNNADALYKAIKVKTGNQHQDLLHKLQNFANIFRSKGPMTTKEADKFFNA